MIGLDLAPFRDLHCAMLGGEGAARVKAAAGRGIYRAGRRSFEDDTLAGARDVRVGDGHGG